ncbi:WD40/YVTN/BNR-like repeat-containing protein [Shivajiella indica]|uniref:WD40/YVTN/BNR-like repeat-containing protein n=1 Tax=Shivajiella indica TaxID=872115 RepID=A0ABW5B1N0_9BACT
MKNPLGWDLLETSVNSSIRGLSPVTSNIVWASGSGGIWLRTLDGGVTWDSGIIDGLDSVDFRDIEGLDAATAVAVSAGQPAVIYKTKDGGITWEKKFQGSEKDFFDGMVFHKNHGFVIGDVVDGLWRIIYTKDFGETWIISETSPKGKIGSGSFAASGSGILVNEDDLWFISGGEESKLFYSPDRGFHWSEFSTPIIQGEPSQGAFSLTLIDQNVLFAVGGDFMEENSKVKNAMISLDKGKSWSLPEGNPPSGYRSGVTYYPFHHWLISVGPNGSDFSKNGGHDWERFSDVGFHAVFLDKSQSSIWASGPDGKIARLKF